MKPRIIVCGLGRTGYKIFQLLGQQGADAVGISDRPMPGERKDNIVIGNLRSAATLIAAGIRSAESLVLANNDDGLNLAILTQARVLNPRIRIVNRLFNATLGDRLDKTLQNHVSMSVPALAAPSFAFAALGNKASGQLQLFDRTWPIYEEIIDENHPWLYHPLSSLWESRSRMLIYYLPATGEFDLMTAIDKGKQLQIGDRLIVGTQPQARSQKRPLARKFLKILSNLRRFDRYGRSVTLVSIALLATILMATLTYVATNFNTSFVDAFYFSVGMITGAGGQEKVAENAPESIKIFTAIMMLIGAGVIGICYALINDFVLGSRIRQFWDAARVPERHHYIVCGLGELGLYIVQQFLEQGYEVVAIENNPNNRLLNAARSLGVPVILEDARLASSLKTANVNTATALIAATNIDTINVEISLCARGLNSQLPVVVRNQEPEFSLAVQQVFGFEMVLCPNELSTPAFAAAALGGQLLGNGMTDDLLWVALATVIHEEHPFCGKTVREASKQADCVPLYLDINGRMVRGWDLLESCLQPSYLLYLTIPATHLDRLWRSSSLRTQVTTHSPSRGDDTNSTNQTFVPQPNVF